MKILLFNSIHHLLKEEKRLKEAGIAYEIIPTPRELSSDCGSAIRLLDGEDETGVSTGLQNQ